MPSNDNVVVARHFESLATATKNYILSSTSQNGGGSTTTTNVFAGATSNTGGASGIVPAPAAGDDDKFLCGNGQWVTIQSGAGGGSYPIATSLEAGLMSAEDKQHLDSVFQSSADFADAVLTGVGGKFIPSVSSVADYMYFKDSNIQFFDNKLNRLCNSVDLYQSNLITTSFSETFLNSSVTLSVKYGDYKYSLHSSAEGTTDVTLPADTSVSSHTFKLFKTADDKGFVFYTRKNETDHITDKIAFKVLLVRNTGQISLSSEYSLATSSSPYDLTASEVSPSVFDPSKIVFLWDKENLGTGEKTYYYKGYNFTNNGATTTSTLPSATVGTRYLNTNDKDAMKGKTDTQIHGCMHRLRTTLDPKDPTKINVTRFYINSSPFWYQYLGYYDDTGNFDSACGKLHFVYGYSSSSVILNTIIWGENATPIGDFSSHVEGIIGLYSDNTRANWYLITARAGTYPNDSTWIDSCFKVWYFNPRTVAIRQCEKSLSQILPKLII